MSLSADPLIVTAEEASSLLLEKMEQLRTEYINEMNSLKQDYHASYLLMKKQMENLPDEQTIPKKYRKYHRPSGKVGDFIMRSRLRRWQFSNLFSNNQKYFRKKYNNFLFQTHSLNLSSSTLTVGNSIKSTRCQFVRNLLTNEIQNRDGTATIKSKRSSKIKKRTKSYGGLVNTSVSADTTQLSHDPSFIRSHSEKYQNYEFCSDLALPFSPYCKRHIICDVKQKLFIPCNSIITNDVNKKFMDINTSKDRNLEKSDITQLESLTAKENTCTYPCLNIIPYLDSCPIHFTDIIK